MSASGVDGSSPPEGGIGSCALTKSERLELSVERPPSESFGGIRFGQGNLP
jgi:hypothetical protein